MSNRTKYLTLCVIFLTLGVSFYIFFCPDTYISIVFHRLFPIPIDTTQTHPVLRGYLPDFLWGLAFSFGLLSICEPQNRKSLFLCTGIPVLMGMMWELLQYLDIVAGTGDLIDVAVYLSASLLALTTNRKERNHNENP